LDAEGLKELFAPFGAVAVRRMFSGHGIYADGLCFAIQIRGEVYLRTDGETKAEFDAAGCERFIYSARGKAVEMPYSRLAASAFDGDDELKAWCRLALAAARRNAAAKTKPAKSAKPKQARTVAKPR
jgi:DNA transformation protein and related proteins